MYYGCKRVALLGCGLALVACTETRRAGEEADPVVGAHPVASTAGASSDAGGVRLPVAPATPDGEPMTPPRAEPSVAAADGGDVASDGGSADERSPSPVDASTVDAGTAEPVSSEPIACSDQEPPSGSACATETEICSRWSTDPATGYDTYFACACRAKTSTQLVWDCYEHWGGSLQCPHEQPEDGSSCNGFKDMTCPYPPREQCYCPIAAAARWSCPEPPTPAEAPASIDPEKLVRDLSDAERQVWCEWLLSITVEPGFPAPPEVPPTADGFYPNSACTGCGGGVSINAMMPLSMPASACVANLQLSTCEAPVAELNDCTRSMMSVCWPQPRGCARYFEAPGCAGTIASRGAQCPLRVR